MRKFNFKDALIGALAAAVLFMIIGATTPSPVTEEDETVSQEAEEIVSVFSQSGATVVFTNNGNILVSVRPGETTIEAEHTLPFGPIHGPTSIIGPTKRSRADQGK
jgi:hypothetical protein